MIKSKRKYLILLSLILIIIAIYCANTLSKPKVKLVDFTSNEVSLINIFNGNTGKEINVDESSDISKIISNLNTIKFVKDISNEDYTGFGFAMDIYDLDGDKSMSITVNAPNLAIYDGYFYKAKSNSIDYNFIEGLFGKYKNI